MRGWLIRTTGLIGVAGMVVFCCGTAGRTAARSETDVLMSRALRQLKAYIKDMQRRNAALQRKIQSLRHRLQEGREDQHRLKREITSLQNEIHQLTLKRDILQQEGYALEGELEWLRRTLRQDRKHQKDLLKDVMMARRRLRRLKQAIDEYESGVLKTARSQEQHRRSRADAKKRAALSRMKKRVKRLRTIKQQWEQRRRGLEERYLKLAARNDALNKRLQAILNEDPVETLKQRWVAIDGQIKTLQREAERLKESLPLLEEDWRRQEATMRAVAIETRQLEEYRQILLHENAALKEQLARRRSLSHTRAPSGVKKNGG